MNSLLHKEGMTGKVQMIYIDPPYGIKYGSNFQPFINKRDVKDGKDEDLTQEPETIKAFRDTWELGIHSYLTYFRDRLLLAKELLTESGSCFVQISDENVHFVRCLMDEIFGKENFIRIISFRKTSFASSQLLPPISDYLLWYGKDVKKTKYHNLFQPKNLPINDPNFRFIELSDGTRRNMTIDERENPYIIPKNSKIYRYSDITSPGKSSRDDSFKFRGEIFTPGPRHHWKTTLNGMQILVSARRVDKVGRQLAQVKYFEDFPFIAIDNMWNDTGTGGFGDDKVYVVQTTQKTIQRCILMTTDPGDIVFDPTCGSGTTANVSEKWGRRWITCDTSRVAVTLARQRLMTSTFEYYELNNMKDGISSGFRYRIVPHITLGSIANDEPAPKEILYDQPITDKSKIRISGPFTVEAVPSPIVKSIDELDKSEQMKFEADNSISRQGETLRQDDWRGELLKTGIRGKAGQMIEFSRVEPLPTARWLHADAETKDRDRRRVVVSFGPEHAPLESRQVELAIEEAQSLVPKPKLIVFAAFQFDPEAAKDIDELDWPGVNVLKVQMNADLLTEDLKKNRSSNQSFWLIGQPDIIVKKDKGKHIIEVKGFDYYNTKTGEIESGDTTKIAMWMLDIDYDGRSFYPRQVFFPMSGKDDSWSKLMKNLKAYIDEDLAEQFKGTISLPFTAGDKIAVKIIDDRGIESLKIIRVKR